MTLLGVMLLQLSSKVHGNEVSVAGSMKELKTKKSTSFSFMMSLQSEINTFCHCSQQLHVTLLTSVHCCSHKLSLPFCHWQCQYNLIFATVIVKCVGDLYILNIDTLPMMSKFQLQTQFHFQKQMTEHLFSNNSVIKQFEPWHFQALKMATTEE